MKRNLWGIFLSSVALVLSFPPFPTGFIAVGALVPFFFFLEDCDFGDVLRGGYTVGFIWTLGTVYWIGWATVVGLVGVLLILPLFFSLFAVLQKWLMKNWGRVSLIFAPFVWTGVELVVLRRVMGFPWNSLAYTQTYYPSLVQYVSMTGSYGVSFWVVLLNVLFYFLLKNTHRRMRGVVFLGSIFFLIGVVWVHGRWVLSKNLRTEENVRLSLVQGNIDPFKKWTPSFIDSNFVVYRQLTDLTRNENPDLVVWPETATPCYLRHRSGYLRRVKSQVDSLGVPLLTGAPDYTWNSQGTVRRYNGALLIRPDSREIDRYYKIHLVPFSERVPLVEKVPFLYSLAKRMDLDIGNFSPGDSVVVFTFVPVSLQKTVRFSVIICYESVFPYLVREFIREGAKFLVVITNDGWFGRTSGPYQHAQMAIFRAIENRVWVARCANTGISGFIDPYGRIRDRTNLYEEAVLTGSVVPREGDTFFVKHGFLFPLFVLVVDGLLFLGVFVAELCFRVREKNRPEWRITRRE